MRAGATLFVTLALSIVALSFVQVRLSAQPDIRLTAMRAVFDASLTNLGDPAPSIVAARRLRQDHRASIYDAGRTAGAAFIYPPLAAVFYAPLTDMSYVDAHRWLSTVNHLLFVGIGLFALVLLARRAPIHWWEVTGLVVAVGLFYPLLRALELNQATVALTFVIGLALVLLEYGKERAAGIAFAFAILFKPHMILVLPLLAWHARRTIVWTLGTGVGLLVLSLGYAGIDNHVDYVTEILPVVSRGYAFYPNHSWNGVLHRLGSEADIVNFALAPASSFVRVGATVLALATYAGAVFYVRRWHSAGIPTAWVFAFGWLVTTLVSPVAWEHHYAPAIFLFGIAYGFYRRRGAPPGTLVAVLFAVGFGLLASYFEVRGLSTPASRLLVSYVFAGGLVLWAAWTRLVDDVSAVSRPPGERT